MQTRLKMYKLEPKGRKWDELEPNGMNLNQMGGTQRKWLELVEICMKWYKVVGNGKN